MIKLPKILKYPNFSRLYYAGLTSELGSFVTETALMLLVFKLSEGDKSKLGIIRASFLFFLTMGSLLGGPIGEKFNRRNVLIFANIIRIPIITVLFFNKDFYSILLVNAMVAFFTGIYNPSRQAMINDIVPQKEISIANSLFGSTMAILHMVGPFIGALVFSKMQGIDEILTFDLVTYFLGIALISTINYRPPKKESVEDIQTSLFYDLKEGLRYALKREDLRALLFNCSIAGFCIGVLIPLLLPFVTEVLHLSDREYGLMLSVFGLGGFFGGIISHRLTSKHRPGKLIVSSIVFEPLLMLLWLLIPVFIPNLIIFFFWGVIVFIRIPSQLNYVSETVETEYLSRIHSILDLSFVVPNISGGIIIAFIGNSFSTMEMLFSTATLFVILIFFKIFTRSSKALYKSEAKKVTRDQSIQDGIA